MKIFLLCLVAFLLYQSPQARNGTANILRELSEVIETDPNPSKDVSIIIPNPFAD